MNNQEMIDLIASIAELDAENIEVTSTLESIEWDSLMDLSFIAGIDKSYGITVSSQELTSCKTVSDLISLVIK